jgi:hypothetical protein
MSDTELGIVEFMYGIMPMQIIVESVFGYNFSCSEWFFFQFDLEVLYF